MRKKYLSRLSAVFLIFFMVMAGIDSVMARADNLKKSKQSSSRKNSSKKRGAASRSEAQGIRNFGAKVFINNQSQYSIVYMPNDYKGFNGVTFTEGGSEKVPETEIKPGSSIELGFIRNDHPDLGIELITPLQFRLLNVVDDEESSEHSFSAVFSSVSGEAAEEDFVQWKELGRESGVNGGDRKIGNLSTSYLGTTGNALVKWGIITDQGGVENNKYYAEYTITVLNSSAESSGGAQPQPLLAQEVRSIREAAVALEIRNFLDKNYKEHREKLDASAVKLRKDVDHYMQMCATNVRDKVVTQVGPTPEWNRIMREVNGQIEKLAEKKQGVEQTDGGRNTFESTEYIKTVELLSSSKKLEGKLLGVSRGLDSLGTKMRAHGETVYALEKSMFEFADEAEEEAMKYKQARIEKEKRARRRSIEALMEELGYATASVDEPDGGAEKSEGWMRWAYNKLAAVARIMTFNGAEGFFGKGNEM